MPQHPNPIIETSMRLLASYPDSPAMEILDQAMKGHKDTGPDFESYDPGSGARPHPAYDDETDANTPFGELLRRAFAPTLDPRELMLLRIADEGRYEPAVRDRISKMADEWQKVIDAFGQRYELWTD